jgi:hypothetical protein
MTAIKPILIAGDRSLCYLYICFILMVHGSVISW